MRQRRRYRNPPIEEAICEFRFEPDQDWNLTIPGKLQAALGNEYLGKPREQKVMEVGFSPSGSQPPSIQFGEGIARVQLATENGRRTVGIGQDVLSIHMLRPYHDPNLDSPRGSGWTEFYSRIEEALEAYWRVAAPIGVNRVGIRYINRITIPMVPISVDDYLKCALPTVSGLPEILATFVSRVEYIYGDNVRLILSQGSIDEPSGQSGFLLDLDVLCTTKCIGSTDALAKADDLHTREGIAFEALITDKARERFNGS